VAILRYFTVYGPAGRPDMSPFRFIEWIRRGQPIQLYGDGKQTRDFTYIDDIAAGTLAALEVKGAEVINLGGGNTPISVNAMIGILEQALGEKAIVKHLPSNNADMHDTSAEIRKARQILGWSPLTLPVAGLENTAAWHRDNEKWLSPLEFQPIFLSFCLGKMDRAYLLIISFLACSTKTFFTL
jgi:UDP-glucuronate 4-epimerase